MDIKDKKFWIPFLGKWFAISFFIHFICSIFNMGFYHFDEHYQILEYLHVKLKGISPDYLPWEYGHKMRSWTQPGLYFLIAKFLGFFGMENPFNLAFVFRFFTSMTGWFSLCTLSLSLFFLFKEDVQRKWGVIFLTLVWYIPFIQTRPSSEGLGSNVFILGLSMMVWGLMRKKSFGVFPFYLALMSGVLFGLSFTFRFQLGILVMFVWLWAILIGKIRITSAMAMVAGIVSMILVEVLVDYWGYGEWTFVPYNYLYQNLVLDKVSGFGKDPWWQYFKISFTKGIPPISILLIFSQVLFWIKRKSQLLTWSTLPLFLIHTMISHKTIRFIFPVALLAPLTLLELPALLKLSRDFFQKKWVKNIACGLMAINLLVLLVVSLKPAQRGVVMYKDIYNNRDKIKKIYYRDNWSLHSFVGLPQRYYRSEDLITSIDKPDKNEKEYWYFVRGLHFLEESGYESFMRDGFFCELAYSTHPLFLLKMKIGNWPRRTNVWGLYLCKNKMNK
ncbi:MAG: hypothetical protein OXB84_09215 [Halobacteriovoraceae bacterium]|nr:hypothetical protein [Halobacteriovoraceae bacterium]